MMYVRIAHKSLATYAGLFPMGSRNKNKMAEDVERGQKRKHKEISLHTYEVSSLMHQSIISQVFFDSLLKNY